jgi:hypothetical protein
MLLQRPATSLQLAPQQGCVPALDEYSPGGGIRAFLEKRPPRFTAA